MGNGEIFDNRRAEQLWRQGDAFAGSARFQAALNGLGRDPRALRKAIDDPAGFLRKARLSLPKGLGFELFERLPRFDPFPDWTPWVIELTQCRRIFRIECGNIPNKPHPLHPCTVEEDEICLGFRIYPRPWPRGPLSL